MTYNFKKIRCVICTMFFLALLIISWGYLSDRMELKSSHIKYDNFFECGNGVDVLFLGSSHVINAVFPDKLWEDYGITSYNLANHGEMMPTSYEVLKNALDYSAPQVVVVDMFTVSGMGTYYNKAFSHVSLDAFPLTATKLNSINTLFEGIDIKCEFVSNFCLYHTRWDEWNKISPEYTPSAMKGAEMRVNVEASVGSLTESDMVDETMTDGIEAVMKIKKLCDEKGIRLVCINIPYSGFEERDAAINYAASLMKDAGIIYLDFRSENSELKLDPKTDFYDTQHVNPLGGRKVTEYLGKYLVENCMVQDRRESEYAGQWNRDVALSYAERMQQLKRQAENGNIVNALMMMKANGAKGIITVTPYSFFRNQETITDLLQQMGFETSELYCLGTNSAWVGVYDEKNGIAYSRLVNAGTDFQLLDFTKGGDSFYLKYLGDNHFSCSWNGEEEIGLHNQMMMLYLFDDEGNLLIRSGLGTS